MAIYFVTEFRQAWLLNYSVKFLGVIYKHIQVWTVNKSQIWKVLFFR